MVPLGIVQNSTSHVIGLRSPHIEAVILAAHERVTLMKQGIFRIFVLSLCAVNEC